MSPGPGLAPGGTGGRTTGHPSASSVRAAPGRRRPPRVRVPGPDRGTLYRGGAGMWSWVAHRVTGFLVYVFLVVHVLDTALVRVSPQAYDAVIATYKNPVVGLAEVGLVGAVLFHALNGVRIVLVDGSRRAARHPRGLSATVMVLWCALMVPFTVRHVSNVLGG